MLMALTTIKSIFLVSLVSTVDQFVCDYCPNIFREIGGFQVCGLWGGWFSSLENQ